MSTTFSYLYGAETPITFTSLNGLPNGSYAGSLAVDNSANLYEDALVGVTIATGSSGTSATGSVALYVYADVDSTPHYTDNVTGADAVQSATSPTNLKPLGAPINCVANSTTYRGGRYSVAKAFGGWLPKRWGVVALNNTGGTLAGSGHAVSFLPVNEQGV